MSATSTAAIDLGKLRAEGLLRLKGERPSVAVGMWGSSGTSLAMLLDSSKDMSRARATSLMTALALRVPKVTICPTFSEPYFCVT